MIYVASRVKHAPLWKKLRSEGWPILSTWIDEGVVPPDRAGPLWLQIIEEVRRCSCLLVYAELSDFPLKGAMVEVGAALAMGKPVVACFPNMDADVVGSWISHPSVYLRDALEELPVGFGVIVTKATAPKS